MSADQEGSGMRIDPSRAQVLVANINGIRQRVRAANKSGRPVRLVAVSKLKPVQDIAALHQAPTSQLHFGENYYQELLEKSKLLPATIRWHFIGGLQSNKCKPLAEQVPNLWAVESVDSVKKAEQLEKGRAALVEKEKGEGRDVTETLRVFVQVNTSGEESKSGVEPGEAARDLCAHIKDHCPHLKLQGFMTIGAIARSKATTPETENEDFDCLKEVRDKVAKELGLPSGSLELSMGMSSDFEAAIKQGSDEVRVGSDIFGERPAKKDAKITEDVQSNTS